MTLTPTQLFGIRAQANADAPFVASDVRDLLAHIASLKTQLSTIRKEATDAERERAAGIAATRAIRDNTVAMPDSPLVSQRILAGEQMADEIAQAIRAPTGDEGK